MTQPYDQSDGGALTATSGAPRTMFANALPVLLLLGLFNAAAFCPGVIALRAYGAAFLVIVPGTVLISLVPIRPWELSVRITLSIGTSLLMLMLLGLAYSVVLPHLGVPRPLALHPVLIGVDIVTLVALAAEMRKREPLDFLLQGYVPAAKSYVIVVVAVLLPILATLGAEHLNDGGGSGISLTVLILIGVSLCGLVLFTGRLPRWSIATILYSASAATLLMASMRSNYPFGYDIQTEYHVMSQTLQSGIWHVPSVGNAYASMLSITVLPTMLTVTTHVSGTYLFKVLYPLIFSLFPVMVYVTSARWFRPRAAVVGAVILIVQGFYAADMTGLARQEIALIYFALLVVVAFDERVSRNARQISVVIAGLGMAISHYSTAYFACTILVLGFAVHLPFRGSKFWRGRQSLFTFPMVLIIVGIVILWNVVVTRSAQNLANLAATVDTNGFQLLPSSGGASLLSRFLSSDVTPTVTAAKFAATIVPYYHTHFPFIHPYSAAITNKFPVKAIVVPATHRNVPMSFSTFVNNATAVLNEVILLVMGIGVAALLWRERHAVRGTRAALGFIAAGCLFLLAVLRLSATVSTLYNAPRGQVQGAPVLSVGVAVVCSWMFAGRATKAAILSGFTALCLALLLFTDSGLSNYALGGEGADILVNYGDAYESYYYTSADIDSAQWVAAHDTKGQVIYTDVYGAVQLSQVSQLNGVITTVIPAVIEPGALVYATSSNYVHHTARSAADNVVATYRFPLKFLNTVKNVVFTTGTTEVFL